MTVNIKFLGHSAFEITYDRYNILIDPFISGNPDATCSINQLQPTDILITHAHADHLGDAIPISKKTGAKLTAIFETANYAQKRGAVSQGVNLGGAVPFEWGCGWWLPAAHSSSTVDGEYGGCSASILLEIDGKKIYHAGDTGLHYDLKMIGEFYKPDIASLPIGGFYTMGIEEALQAVKWLGCKHVIPMHYDTFPPIASDAQKFKEMVESQTSCKCHILKPNEAYSL